jgi:hypothetical protein
MSIPAGSSVCDMDSINRVIARNIEHGSQVTAERQAELIAKKEQLLKRGLIILMRADDYEGRERFLNEYSALSRIINENERILEAEAA